MTEESKPTSLNQLRLLDWRYKIKLTSDHGAKFRHDRPTELADTLAIEKKSTSAVNVSQLRKLSFPDELTKVNIANICTRSPQSLSSLRARRDHDPALRKEGG